MGKKLGSSMFVRGRVSPPHRDYKNLDELDSFTIARKAFFGES